MSPARSLRPVLLGLTLLALGACSSPSEAEPAVASDAPTALTTADASAAPASDQESPAVAPVPGAIELAPLPYTAEQIRAANPDGTEVVFAMRDAFGGGSTRVMRFENGDAEGVTVLSWHEDADGERLPGNMSARSTWQELRQHAAYPAAHTTRSEARRQVGAGDFDCWIYEVRDPAQPGMLQRFAFAKDRAGPPVHLEIVMDGATISTMELIEVR